MATPWATLDLSGIPAGTNLTSANTGNFFDLGYPTTGGWLAANVTGGGIGIQPRSNAAANGSKNLAGHSAEGRIGYKIEFLSVGAATGYFENFMLRTGNVAGGTILYDTGLRNASGTREMANRNNFVYVGQATGNPMTAGEQWSVEIYWDGTTATTYVWDSPVTSGAPTYTWGPATMPNTPGNLLFGPDGAESVEAILYDIWITDGARRDETPIPGTLDFVSNVWADSQNFYVTGKTTSASTVTLKINGVTTNVTPDAAGYFKASASSLTAGTSYPWEILVDGASRRTSTVKTLPGDSTNVKFVWGSCFDTNTSGVFSLIDSRTPDFIANLGDWGYQYITGGPNGNTSPTDVATVRTHREAVLTAAAPQGLFSKYPTSYTYSDCDGGGANADSTTGGMANGVVQTAYRQQFAHPNLLSPTGFRGWRIGRVMFIQTDETTAASSKSAPDNSSKTKLGAHQKALFKLFIDDAATNGYAVVWFGDGPWIEPTQLTGNSWRAYNTERTELGTYIANSGVKLIRLHGDTHTLFCDDGTNNPWGGFPTASAAPLHTTAQPFSFPISGTSYPSSTTNSSRQYGVGEITDNGSVLTLTVKGYSSTPSAPTEVERFSMSVNLTPQNNIQPWDNIYTGSAKADFVYVGGTLVWSAN